MTILDETVYFVESLGNQSDSTMTITNGTLQVPGAALYYEVRGAGPLLALHAAPMDAAAFAPLAELLASEFTVLTSDPRGINRSRVHDEDRDVSPDERADDLAALISRVGVGPVTVLGSSGGAVSALALAQRRPDLVATVVAHEPPLVELLPDRALLRRRTEAMVQQYIAGDRIGGWREFLDIANIAMPGEVFDDVFGSAPEGRAADDERFSFEHMELATSSWLPDVDALRRGTTRIVIGIGEDSAGELCDRASRALADALGLTPVGFPGGHIGFVEDADTFADRLREVLA